MPASAFPLLKFLVPIIAALVVSFAFSHIQKLKLERKLGAKPVRNVEQNGWFGIRFGFKVLHLQRNGTLTEFQQTRYAKLRSPHVALFLMTVFGKKVIVTSDPENIKAILATQFENFTMGNRHEILYSLLGDGIFASDGKPWSHSRAMLKPQFTRQQVGRLSSLEPHVRLLAQHVLRNKGKSFEMQELLFRFTVDSATSILFGESAKALESCGHDSESDDFQFANAFNIVQKVIATRLLLQGMNFLSHDPAYNRSLRIINDFADYYIKKTLALPLNELEQSEGSGYVFLHSLCKDTRDPKVLRDELLNILVAGRDTTAALLSFTIYELARNKKMWQKLRLEVSAHLGSNNEAVSFETLKQCLYLKAVLNELLRMYPPVPINARTSHNTTTLPRGGGPDGQSPILVLRGQTVAYCVYAMHRNPDIYGNDAGIFDPERWSDGRTKGLGWAYLPFNGGPRVCLGQQFALTEASYVLVRLAQMFSTLELAHPEAPYPPKISSHMTISLADGLEIYLS